MMSYSQTTSGNVIDSLEFISHLNLGTIRQNRRKNMLKELKAMKTGHYNLKGPPRLIMNKYNFWHWQF